MTKLQVKTFGCRLNAFESEVIRVLAAKQNVQENVIVFNTCSVTQEAIRQSKQQIRRIYRESPDYIIIVTGCAAQLLPDSFSNMKEVFAVIGNIEKLSPVQWDILQTKINNRKNSDNTESDSNSTYVQVSNITSEQTNYLNKLPTVHGTSSQTRVYVQIQSGCNHSCTFCIIPFTRGASKSRSSEQIIEQVAHFTKLKYKEIVLTGVDITSWGHDLPGQPTLGSLIQDILKAIPDLNRLRLSSVDCADLYSVGVAHLIKQEERLMPHLHLSLQSGDNMILKRMKRRHSREMIIDCCNDIRKSRPNVTFGADIIAGFPTETDDMFFNSLQLISEIQLAFLHVFPFSPHEKTPASRMPQVPTDVARHRAQQLRKAGENEKKKWLASLDNTTQEILIEKSGIGRTPCFAEVKFNTTQPIGEVVKAVVHTTGELHLCGEVI